MCQHEGQECPGRSCDCECMNCMFPVADDEECDEPEDYVPDPAFTAAVRELGLTGQVCVQSGCQAYFDPEIVSEPAGGQPGHTGWRWLDRFPGEDWTVVHEHRLS